MRRFAFLRACVPALAAAGAWPRVAAAQDVGLPPGATPPAVVIEDLDGNPVDLGQFIGKKPVLLEFWATWCPVCAALEPRIAAAQRRFGDDVAFLVVAVAVNQTPRRVRRHLEAHPVPGRVLWDVEGRATRAFLAPTTSYVVVLDAAGRVVYTGTGDGQDIEGALEKAVGTADSQGQGRVEAARPEPPASPRPRARTPVRAPAVAPEVVHSRRPARPQLPSAAHIRPATYSTLIFSSQ